MIDLPRLFMRSSVAKGMQPMLNIIDIIHPKKAVPFLKRYWSDYRWIQNYFDVIEKAELCFHFCTP